MRSLYNIINKIIFFFTTLSKTFASSKGALQCVMQTRKCNNSYMNKYENKFILFLFLNKYRGL